MSLEDAPTSEHVLAMNGAPTNEFVVEQRRRRTELSPKVKKEICLWKAHNPATTQKDVCAFAEQALGVRIGRSTVCDILKDRDKWVALGDVAMSTRMRRPKYEQLESALSAWCDALAVQTNPPPITDDMLREKAKTLGMELGIKDFHYSSSWLSRYKMRRMMFEAVREESSLKWDLAAVPMTASDFASLDNEVDDTIRPQTAAMQPRNHYFYCEAFDLRYRMDWHIAPNPDHLSLLLTFDLSTKERLMPLVVWRLPRARCFGPLFDPNQLCQWRHSAGAQLTPDIVNSWLDALDADCRQKDHRAVLLANVPSHILPQTPRTANIAVYPASYWPKSPDAKPFEGIGGHFKALFGIQQLSQLIEASEECSGSPSMDVKQALYCVRDAWAAIRPELVIRRLQMSTDLDLPFDDESYNCSCSFLEQKLNDTLGHGSEAVAPKLNLDAAPPVELDDSEAPAEVTAEEARRAAERLALFAEQHLGEGLGRFSVADLDTLRSTRRQCAFQIRERKRHSQAPALPSTPVKVERCETPFSIQ